VNLEKLLNMQHELLEHIINDKGLEDKNLVADTFLSLQVEMSEFANEGRWFKYWSHDQEPRTEIKCHACNGEGGFIHTDEYQVATEPFEECMYCGGTGIQEKPLLEEYVDVVHMFLQVAILKKWEDALRIYEEQLDPDEFDGNLTEWFLEMTYFINKSYFENPDEEKSNKFKKHFGFPMKQYWFRTAWILFLNIGINGFGFSLEQIEQAYLNKNKINHDRQSNGY